MTVPTVSVRVAPGSAANDRNPGWSEIGSLLKSFTFTRGRQYELDRNEAGTCKLTFINSSRTLDPSYTRGPFYPNLLPNAQVSLQATYGGLTYDLFRGHIERFTTSWEGPTYGETTLECIDRTSALAQATISGTFNEQLTGARILAVLAAAGWPTTTVPSGWTLGTSRLGVSARLGATVPINSIDSGRATVASATFTDSDAKLALDHIQEVTDSEPGRFFFDGAGLAVFQDRGRYVPVPAASSLTLTDDPAGAAGSSGSGELSMFGGETLAASEFAGGGGVSGGTAAVVYRDVAVNDDIDLIRNDIRLSAADGAVTGTTDTPSIDMYSRRTLPRATQLRSWDSETWQQANWLLYLKKDARTRIQQVTIDAWQATDWPALLNSELGDHVTLLRTPPGATSETLTQESFLEKLTVDGEPGAKWQVTYELSPIVSPPAGWTLGASTVGSTTRLVYA